MKKQKSTNSFSWGSRFIDRHPVIANLVIICIIAVLGIYAAYLATAIFTKHGLSTTVPGVENMSYSQAITKLHDNGFKVDIRDSLYREDVKPGYVIEQFPKRGATVKPGRKIFLYINAVHPKEVVLDNDNHPSEYALKGNSHRSAIAKLEELGFKTIRVVKVLGNDDRVVKVLANGRPVRKMQKIPVNSSIVVEISDGRLYDLQDSLMIQERIDYMREEQADDSYSEEYYNAGAESYESEDTSPVESKSAKESSEESTESQYF